MKCGYEIWLARSKPLDMPKYSYIILLYVAQFFTWLKYVEHCSEN